MKPTTPQKAAGSRTDPPVSLPSAKGQKRAAKYFTNELLEAKKHFSHIEGFATLTEANIRAIGGVVFLSNLRLQRA